MGRGVSTGSRTRRQQWRRCDEQGGSGGHGYLALGGLPPGQVRLGGPVVKLVQPPGLLPLAQRPLLLVCHLPALPLLPRQVHRAPRSLATPNPPRPERLTTELTTPAHTPLTTPTTTTTTMRRWVPLRQGLEKRTRLARWSCTCCAVLCLSVCLSDVLLFASFSLASCFVSVSPRPLPCCTRLHVGCRQRSKRSCPPSLPLSPSLSLSLSVSLSASYRVAHGLLQLKDDGDLNQV